ncbi:MFS transporter [Pseudonocardia pini]|uniref:MFS transporter n=1 Tax=Pseudonocardia pini TaxID=2758030 RepID=UPI0015F0D1BD|nr:MFS transporter [Pseudonocardia pini]
MTAPSHAAVFAKARRRLVPFCMLMLFLSIWDRTNVSLAALQMNADIGLSTAAFGLGAGIFFLAYALLEVPSNLLLAKVGPRVWLARIMLTWGLVTVATAAVQGPGSFYTVRVLLGVAEAGLMPGMIVYLSTWFPAEMRARVISQFSIGALLALLLGNPLSGWILSWTGPLPGWRWLFLVSGVATLVVGVAVLRFLPGSPAEARWLSPAERQVVESAGAAAEPGDHSLRTQLAAFRVLVRQPSLLAMTVVLFLLLTTGYALTFFLPTLLKGFAGLDTTTISLLVSVPPLIAVVACLIVGPLAERTRRHLTILVVMCLIGALGVLLMVPGESQLLLLVAGAAAIAIPTTAYTGVFWAVVTPRLGRAQTAAGTIALVNAVGITGGFVGPFAFGWVLAANEGRLLATPPIVAGILAACAVVLAAVGFAWRRGRDESRVPVGLAAHDGGGQQA